MAEEFGSSKIDSRPERSRTRPAKPEKFGSSSTEEGTGESVVEEQDEGTAVARPSVRTTGFVWENGSLWAVPPKGKRSFYYKDIQVHDRTVSVKFVLLESEADAFVLTNDEYERVLVELE